MDDFLSGLMMVGAIVLGALHPAAIWVFARRYRANQHICATRQCLLGQVWTFFRTKCEGRLDMNQLARGEAPHRGEPFLGLPGRGVGIGRRPRPV